MNKKWQRRKQGAILPQNPDNRQSTTLGRIYTVHSRNTECYLLRLVLLHVRRPTSFADLQTVFLIRTRKRAANADFRPMISIGILHSQQRSPIVRTKFATCLPSCFTCAKFPILFVFGSNTKKQWPKIFFRTLRRRANNDTLPLTDAIFNQALLAIEEKLLSFPGGKP